MNGNKKRIIAVLSAAAAVMVLIVVLAYGRKHGWFLPRWAVWNDVVCMEDAHTGMKIRLNHRTVSVESGGNLIWTSDAGVKVQDIQISDIDADGKTELLLLCWKIGRYGRSRPFWVKEDETGWSQHLFVYQLDTDKVTSQWMSSYIGVDVTEMAVEALPDSPAGDGAEPAAAGEMIVFTDPEGEVSRWFWNSWGFTRLD